jgi:WD40 repeat protein
LAAGATAARLVAVAESHADWVTGVAFVGDGRRLVTASRDKTAKVFDVARNEPALSFPNHQAAVHGVAVRADGTVAYSVGADRTLRLWGADGDGKQMKVAGGHGDEVLRVVCHPHEPVVVTASADKTVRVWKDDGTAIRTLTGINDVPYALAISPDGRWLAAGCAGGEVVVWSVADGKLVKRFNASPGWPR